MSECENCQICNVVLTTGYNYGGNVCCRSSRLEFAYCRDCCAKCNPEPLDEFVRKYRAKHADKVYDAKVRAMWEQQEEESK